MSLTKDQRAFVIRALNDTFRQTFAGGLLTIRAGVAALCPEVRAEVLRRVREFIHFTPENNPHIENDFGSFKILDAVYAWKIDCYDKNMEFGSPDPTDPRVTTRVLTIMSLDEY